MKILYVAILLNCFTLLGQNPSYKLFKDSLLPLAATNYVKAKEVYIENRKHYDYDPINVYLFLEYSLINKDIKFFEKNMIHLIKDFGYYYFYKDTLVSKIEGSFENEIYNTHYDNWLKEKTAKYYPKWLKNHPEAIEIQRDFGFMLCKDQLTRNLIGYVKYLPVVRKNIIDTNELKKYNKKIDTIYHVYDLQNVKQLENIYKKKGRALNNFEDGFVLIPNVIVFHNLKEGNLTETWNRLFKYYEAAYIDGKISEIYFEMYDAYLFKYEGKQYYGTLGKEVPIKDEVNFEARKNRLKLNTTKNHYL